MVDFFTKSDGASTAQNSEFENAGGQKLIEAGTTLKCRVADIEWLEATDFCEQCLAILLDVVEPGEYKGVTVRHKLRLLHEDDSKADKAKDALGVYNVASGGKLQKVLESNNAYNNAALARALNGTPIIATFDVYEMDDRKGNWVRKVVALKGKVSTESAEAQAAQVEADHAQQTAYPPAEDDFVNSDGIPF